MTSPATEHAEKLARLLRENLAAARIEIPHSLALELTAHQLGTRDWNVLAALTSRAEGPSHRTSARACPLRTPRRRRPQQRVVWIPVRDVSALHTELLA
jgi:hypothetical protein